MNTGNYLTLVLTFIYFSLLACLSVFLLFRFRKTDRASGFICILIWVAFISELTAKYTSVKYHTNMPVYAIYGFLEFIMVSLYFNYSIDTFRKHHIGYFTAVVGVAIGVANSIWYQPLNTLNTLYIFLECIGIVCMSLYSFYRLLLINTTLRLRERVHFWIPCIFLFYWCTTLSSWGLYDYFRTGVKDKTRILNISLSLVNILTYFAYGIVFFLYPKMKSIDE